MVKKIESVNNGTGINTEGYNKIESWDGDNISELSSLYYRILKLIGEDPDREGLKQTPSRVAKALHFLMMGYNQDPCMIINSAKFREKYKQMVLVKDIDIYSMCEHHMLPFFGKAHVAYIPDGYITGLSKIARVVEAFSRRLQVQERLTTQTPNIVDQNIQSSALLSTDPFDQRGHFHGLGMIHAYRYGFASALCDEFCRLFNRLGSVHR